MKLFLYCFREFDEKKYFDELSEILDFTYDYTHEYPNEGNANLARGYDGVSITPTLMDAELLEIFNEHGIRYILARSIGYDHIDLDKAKQLEMKVSHVSYPPEAVADYAIMLILMCLRKMPFIMEQSGIQNFSLNGKIGKSICDTTIGVIGTGRIGGTVIKHLSSFGCRIIAFDPYVNKEMSKYCEYVDLERLFRESDVITLHAPATDENYHLLNRQAFSKMKTSVIIVNTSRGTLIDTDALIKSLETGHTGGAALDVLEDEKGLYYINRVGDCIDNRQMAILRSFPNVLLTPHTAFYTEQTVRSMAENTVQCLFDMENNVENSLIIV
jgi:D-lactate dehydrogenase